MRPELRKVLGILLLRGRVLCAPSTILSNLSQVWAQCVLRTRYIDILVPTSAGAKYLSGVVLVVSNTEVGRHRRHFDRRFFVAPVLPPDDALRLARYYRWWHTVGDILPLVPYRMLESLRTALFPTGISAVFLCAHRNIYMLPGRRYYYSKVHRCINSKGV